MLWIIIYWTHRRPQKLSVVKNVPAGWPIKYSTPYGKPSTWQGVQWESNCSVWMDGERNIQRERETEKHKEAKFNLYAPCVLYIGQTYRFSPQYSFYIFSQQIYLIIFLDFLSPSSFIPPQNVLYFLMLLFLVHKIFTLYINGVLNCKYPAPGPKGLIVFNYFADESGN